MPPPPTRIIAAAPSLMPESSGGHRPGLAHVGMSLASTSRVVSGRGPSSGRHDRDRPCARGTSTATISAGEARGVRSPRATPPLRLSANAILVARASPDVARRRSRRPAIEHRCRSAPSIADSRSASRAWCRSVSTVRGNGPVRLGGDTAPASCYSTPPAIGDVAVPRRCDRARGDADGLEARSAQAIDRQRRAPSRQPAEEEAPCARRCGCPRPPDWRSRSRPRRRPAGSTLRVDEAP